MKKFITFEGIDCSGKTTQIELLKNRLIDEKQNVYIVRDPGGTEVSESIRKIILDTNNSINEASQPREPVSHPNQQRAKENHKIQKV